MLIVCPARRAGRIAAEHSSSSMQIEHVVDKNLGRSAALNAALPKARAPIIVAISDHVIPERGGIAALIAPFADPAVDATCGRPVALADGDGLLDTWQRALLQAAHRTREWAVRQGKAFPLSGELFAFRRNVLTRPIPFDCWHPDVFVTQTVGTRSAYVPGARVKVPRAPDLGWWLREKTQSLATAQQTFVPAPGGVHRLNFELHSLWWLIGAIRSPRDALVVVSLIAARLVAWIASWFALTFARTWLADSHTHRYPSRAPRVREVYDMARADLDLGNEGRCEVVIRQVIDDEHLRVIPRLAAAYNDWSAIPSPAAGSVFPRPGAFLNLAQTVDIMQLGDFRGSCPEVQWRSLRDVQ